MTRGKSKKLLKQYVEEHGVAFPTFYSRLKKHPELPYPPIEPYSQYDCILQPIYKKHPKQIDLDVQWERICKSTDPDSREVSYLKVLANFLPIPKEDIESLQHKVERKNSIHPYVQFQNEIGIEGGPGRPRKK